MEKQGNVSAEIINDQTAYEMALEYANSPEHKEEVMKRFVKAFGQNAKVRTRKQWANLVRVYGIDTVVSMEHLTKEEITLKCTETLSQRLSRINRIRQTLK